MDVNTQPLRIIRMPEVAAKVALQPSTIYAMVQAGQFPPPFKIAPGGRAAGWLLGHIDAWLLQRADSTDSPVNPGQQSLQTPYPPIFMPTKSQK